MLKKLTITLPLILTGCSASLIGTVSDYTGSDSARIRAKNYLPPLTLSTYKQVGGCYQEIESKTLTAGVNVLGIKSTSNKSIPGMTSRSSELEGLDVLEYTIKADQYMAVEFVEQTTNTQYNKSYAVRQSVFIPERGHDYDIYPTNSGVVIKDLTNSDGKVRDWGAMKECKYKIFLGKKDYD